MDLAEAYVKFCIQYVFENNAEDLEYFEKEEIRRAGEAKKPAPEIKLRDNLKLVMNSEFKRITYDEAISICIKVIQSKDCFLILIRMIPKEKLTLKLNWPGVLI